MTWKKALRTVFTHPLYMLMTLLPQLLLLGMLLPIAQKAYQLVEALVKPVLSSQWMPWLSVSSPSYAEVLKLALPMIGTLLLMLLVNLIYRMTLEPIAVQYMGDAVNPWAPGNFAGRGMRRLWYRPLVFSILASLATSVFSLLYVCLSAWSLLFPQVEEGIAIGFTVFAMLFSVLYGGVYYAFLGISSVEQIGFFPAIGRAFKLFFKRILGYLLPLVLMIGLGFGIGVIFTRQVEAVELFNCTNPTLFLERVQEIINLSLITLAVATLLGWLIAMYLSAYSAWAAMESKLQRDFRRVTQEDCEAAQTAAEDEASAETPEEAPEATEGEA